MAMLAAVEGDGRTPLAEVLLTGLPKLRRGMTAVVVTSSRDRQWVRALTSLRARGVTAAVVTLDAASYAEGGLSRWLKTSDPELAAQEQRALRFALAEYEVKSYEVHAGDNLGAVLA
jgi:hypothetical protein